MLDVEMANEAIGSLGIGRPDERMPSAFGFSAA
jgi:hypothetical protein